MPAKALSGMTSLVAGRAWSHLHRVIPRHTAAARAALALIVVVGAFLRFYELGAHNVGNLYYAATVRSMLTSWHNFFYASFEPGGSLSVDKPPLGFWIQAASAAVFGVNGFALALPQALAGVLSILLLYRLVKSQLGELAGLVSAAVLALMPVAVATERNNTIDGVLVFVLLAAAWAFWRATGSGGVRYLCAGAFLIGLGFNVKMLQALMPVPAFYAAYLLGARVGWLRRMTNVAASGLILLVVSVAWATVVDLTPPEQRPFVGSSTDNTVRELILGHNGLARLRLGPFGGGGPPGPAVGGAGPDSAPGAPAGAGAPRPDLGGQPGPGRPAPSQSWPPSTGPAQPPPQGPPLGYSYVGPEQLQNPGFRPGAPPGVQPGGPRQEVGEPGLARLFREPLITEASWLLPLALMAIPLAVLCLGLKRPLRAAHLSLPFWGIWLLGEVVYFSFTGGIFHVHYLIMLGPPLAALVGIAVWALAEGVRQRPRAGRALLTVLSGGTVAFAMAALQPYPDFARWVGPLAIALWLVSAAAIWLGGGRWGLRAPLPLLLASVLIAPAAWSLSVATDAAPDVGLPHARPRSDVPPELVLAPPANAASPRPAGMPSAAAKPPLGAPGASAPANRGLVGYLVANTSPEGYLAATHTTHEAAPLILATGRPVLAMGGFSGGDHVVDVQRLSGMILAGRLRFVLGGPRLAEQKRDISAWLTRSCRPVDSPALTLPLGNLLFDCRR